MKKIICLCLSVLLILTICSCSKSKPIEQETTLEESQPQQTEVTQSEYLQKNEDGVVAITETDDFYRERLIDNSDNKYREPKWASLDPSEEDKALMKEMHLAIVIRDANMPVYKLRQSDTAAVYEDVDRVNFYKIDSQPKYTLPYNFCFGTNVDSKDEIINEPDRFYFIVDDSYEIGFPIEEINGQKINEFVNSNYEFYTSLGNDYYYDYFKIVPLKKGEKVTIGGYIETEWLEKEVFANVEYYIIDDTPVEIPTEKTKNGYFTVDTSSLEKGLYYIDQFSRVIELV